MSDLDDAWQGLIQAAYRWATQHMDQWEKVKFQTEFGMVYLTIDRKGDGYPLSFDFVDADGKPAADREVKP
jgi:hypothetical protein